MCDPPVPPGLSLAGPFDAPLAWAVCALFAVFYTSIYIFGVRFIAITSERRLVTFLLTTAAICIVIGEMLQLGVAIPFDRAALHWLLAESTLSCPLVLIQSLEQYTEITYMSLFMFGWLLLAIGGAFGWYAGVRYRASPLKDGRSGLWHRI
ncbi:MAG TPA: hypothetical protein VGR57_06050 [Ktedonobacterales bacterium]|nr:hypothetical protein [Ktedonobacterales bacterium]